MFTDIVGYTALGQESESAALELLQQHRELLRPIFSKHRGREVKTIGDAFLVEFGSALEATLCAIDVQSSVHSLNLERGRKLLVRIGIHVGDVMSQGGDVLGDAVNVASRIEPLATPGGICISGPVRDHVKNKVSYPLIRLGQRELKNVREPVEVYKVELPWEEKGIGAEPVQQLDSRRLAILPLTNISADPNDEYFADGMTEELISTTSSITGLTLIARTSVMGYKGTSKKVEDIGRELNVGTVLEGSVRKAGKRLRITVQLIDVKTQGHVWAQSYDRDLEDIFAIQKDVAENVAGALKLKLMDSEKNRIEKKPTGNTDAYDLYVRGLPLMRKQDEGSFRKAVNLFESAVNLDPGFAAARARLAQAYYGLGYFGFDPQPQAYAKAKELAAKALALDDTTADAHVIISQLAFQDGDWEIVPKELARALELNQSLTEAHAAYALYFANFGQPSQAVAEITRAVELDPLSVAAQTLAGTARLVSGLFEQAIPEFKKAIEMDPNIPFAYNDLGISYECLGRHQEAIRELEKATELSGRSPFCTSNLAFAYAKGGRRDDALRILDELKEGRERGKVGAMFLAEAYAAVGDNDKALDWLEKADDERTIIAVPLLNIDPAFDSLHEEPRFRSLVAKLGLKLPA